MPRSITMIGNRFKMGHNDKELSHMGYNYAKIEHNDWNIYQDWIGNYARMGHKD